MDQSLLDRIRQANDIVEVISEYIPLKQSGSNYRGICPFHKDTNPSLNVSRSKQIFKCFVCGKAGNSFSFVQEYEKMSFMEAVKKLAARAGIAIPESHRTKVVSTKREQLLAVYQSAKDFYSSSLFEYGDSVLAYLKDRQLSSDTAKSLELGYALNSERSLVNHLLKEGFAVSLLKGSGLFSERQGGLYDLFRDRLIFPIHNSTGQVVAFGGRILAGSTSPNKYMNSPLTELYTKGNELYGLFKTRYEAGKLGSFLVCEGYFDFLRLYEAGFANSVASLGTALTDDQIYLMLRYARHIVMLYDGDASGIKAAVRAGLACMAKGLDVSVVTLPDNADPDSFILAHGKDAMQELIDTAAPLISHIAACESLELDTQAKIEQVLDAIRQLKDPIRRELQIKETSEAFGISSAALGSSLSRSLVRPTEAAETRQSHSLRDYPEEKQLLCLALKDRDSYSLLASQISPDYFNSKIYQSVFRHLQEHCSLEDIDQPSTLLDNIENTQIRECLADLLFEDLQDMRYEDALAQVKIRKIERDMNDLDRMIEREPQNLELLKQKRSLSQVYRRMTKKVVKRVLL